MTSPRILVVGAGISGISCARALHDAGIEARVVDRGRRVGGRMASRTMGGRTVDLGATYFTSDGSSTSGSGADVPDDGSSSPSAPNGFSAVVQSWLRRGVAREWTDTFAVARPDGIHDHRSGPMRYSSPTGLRDLVIDLASELPHPVVSNVIVAHVDTSPAGVVVDGERYETVVLAMPDPQAARLVKDRTRLATEWQPTLAVTLAWPDRRWPDFHGTFVNDSEVLGFIADDGDRRGDAAPVLVAHSTAALAEAHLGDPDGAIPAIAAQVQRILGIADAPTATHAHHWTFARPTEPHDQPFFLADGIGVCGDAWSAKPSVGAAWASGDALGRAIAER